MKVAVFAGTSVDTQMGADLVEEAGYTAMSYPMAHTPQEQTQLQYYKKEVLEARMLTLINEAKTQDAQAVLIYCNSLSSAIDYQSLAKQCQLPVITPLDTYTHLGNKVKHVVVLAANAISAYKVDQIIRHHHPDIATMTVGNLALVEHIETKQAPDTILDQVQIDKWLAYLEALDQNDKKIDGIILACTHFPYIKDALAKRTYLPLIDPTDDILDTLKAINKK